MVGTFRDVTAEHYAVQRESALAALNQQLSQADTLDEALRGGWPTSCATCGRRAGCWPPPSRPTASTPTPCRNSMPVGEPALGRPAVATPRG